jgi:hypothetical protein
MSSGEKHAGDPRLCKLVERSRLRGCSGVDASAGLSGEDGGSGSGGTESGRPSRGGGAVAGESGVSGAEKGTGS